MDGMEAVCKSCGRAPAVEVTIRRHQGMLIMQRFFRLRAPLCRECGERIVKSWTGKTLMVGWWGIISFFVNWFCLASNAVAWRRLNALSQPMPGPSSAIDERPAA
jgi:hypothetical protein